MTGFVNTVSPNVGGLLVDCQGPEYGRHLLHWFDVSG